LGGGGEVGGGFDVEGGVCYCSYGSVLDVLEGPHGSKVVVWRKVLWLVVASGCIERKSDVGRGQGKVSLDVWLLALLGLCLRA
jgi:hypothetical protein